MINCICIPYKDFKQKINITKQLNYLNQKYSDLGGFIYYLENVGNDEMSAARLVKNYKQCS